MTHSVKKKLITQGFFFSSILMIFSKQQIFSGVPLYIIPSDVIYDPALLCDFLSANQITRMLFTPSLFEAVLNTPEIDIQNKLKSMR